ncbi:MAG: hypothetical protein ACXVY8_04835 [Gaiellaceae bacterium]
MRAYTQLVKAIGEANRDLSVDRQVYSRNICLGQRGHLDENACAQAERSAACTAQ